MNALLEKAFAEAARLPETAQKSIASLILEEIEAEQNWDYIKIGIIYCQVRKTNLAN